MYNEELNKYHYESNVNQLHAIQRVVNLHAHLYPDDMWGWTITISDDTIESGCKILTIINNYIKNEKLDNEKNDYYPEMFPPANGDGVQFEYHDAFENLLEIEIRKKNISFSRMYGCKDKEIKDLTPEEFNERYEEEKCTSLVDDYSKLQKLIIQYIDDFIDKKWKYVK